MKDYPKPCTPEAIANGCTCEAEKQTNPNWEIIDTKCPVHGNVEYVLWKAQQPKKRRK